MEVSSVRHTLCDGELLSEDPEVGVDVQGGRRGSTLSAPRCVFDDVEGEPS